MTNSHSLPVLAFTLGDPGGIGPEIILRSLDYFSSGYPFIPVVFGSESVLKHPFLDPYVVHRSFTPFPDSGDLEKNTIYFKQCCALNDIEVKRANSANGFAAYTYIKEAVSCIQSGQADALVTAPICKESFQCADLPYTGHTTLLKSLTGGSDVSMAFHTSRLNVVLATIHVPLQEVPSLITSTLLKQKVAHTCAFLKSLGKECPRIAIAGLNPHAGENGLFGSEEKDIIEPVVLDPGVEAMVTGPYSPDTVFFRASQGEFDCVIALYHDQGLIPVKLLGFHEAVNVTLGLPFIRTSPDHGTAFDRAYEQLSNIDSMIASIRLACQLCS